MKIKMRTTMAGPAGVVIAGQVVDLPKAEAYALVEGRYADQIDVEPETATAEPPENTAMPRRRAK